MNPDSQPLDQTIFAAVGKGKFSNGGNTIPPTWNVPVNLKIARQRGPAPVLQREIGLRGLVKPGICGLAEICTLSYLLAVLQRRCWQNLGPVLCISNVG